jgi:RNA polymerase sigma-70 factor (ECF subfamily)
MAPVDPRLAAAVSGDRQALESLVTELLPRVRNLVRYLVRGDSSVDDIAQEALVAIVRGLPSHRGEGTLRAWADRVTARVTFAHLRKNRRTTSHVDAGADLAAVPDPEGRPDEYTARRKAVEMLDKLPNDQRQALVMHHVLGLSVPEIARELDIPFETVRSRLRIGIAKLRSMHALVP